mgnify:CR=1 FL=1
MRKLYKSNIFLFTIFIFFSSCSFNDEIIEYEEKLVVFASLVANLPVTDTILVSRSASLDEDIDAEDLVVDNAQVRLVNLSSEDKKELKFYSIGSGKYFPLPNDATYLDSLNYISYIIEPGSLYRLIVTTEDDSIVATTTVPESFNITSAEMGDYQCPDGTLYPVSNIDVNNLDNLNFVELAELFDNPENFVNNYNINVDTLLFRIGDCFTKSFASYSMFGVDFEDEKYNTIQIISYALESNQVGMEPFSDSNNNGIFDNTENFSDRNRSGTRDSCFINLIYSEDKGYFNDDSISYNDIANIWKNKLRRINPTEFDTLQEAWKQNTPYRNNPWLWNIETAPSPIMWLYFDYYGYYLMTFKATSESYFNYFTGDPVGQNIYLLPDSNFDDGLGVFYSSVSTSFLVYIERE